MKYDPTIIEKFAEELYAKADSIIIATTVIWGIGGALLGAAVGQSIFGGWALMTLVGGALGGFVGYRRGEEKAFLLKLQAQTALCQVEIERNTKGA